jgi:hypothetical protein
MIGLAVVLLPYPVYEARTARGANNFSNEQHSSSVYQDWQFGLRFYRLGGVGRAHLCHPKTVKSGLERRCRGLYNNLPGLQDQDDGGDGERDSKREISLPEMFDLVKAQAGRSLHL